MIFLNIKIHVSKNISVCFSVCLPTERSPVFKKKGRVVLKFGGYSLAVAFTKTIIDPLYLSLFKCQTVGDDRDRFNFKHKQSIAKDVNS